MNITGMIRAKNAERWIEESVRSLLSVCQNVMVMDDHSTDHTIQILDSISEVIWFRSPYETLNEARDKNVLLATIRLWWLWLDGHGHAAPDWIIHIDADEVLLDPHTLLLNLESGRAPAYGLRIMTLWDCPDQIRVDGIYGDLWRPSVFKWSEIGAGWKERAGGPNLHCGSVPTSLQSQAVRCAPPVRLKHYGSMLKEDRIRKYIWYLANDSDCLESEDHYRHAVQGDLPEFLAKAIYRHGGPLRLEEWEA